MSRDVFAFAARRLTPDQAKDVVSETFEVVWRKMGQVPSEPAERSAWVIGIARNKVRQEVDRARRRPLALLAELDIALISQSARARDVTSSGVAESVVDSIRSREIYGRLSDDEKELFDLAHLKSLTPRDGAQALGISVTAYTTRVNRLRRRIVDLSKDPAESDD